MKYIFLADQDVNQVHCHRNSVIPEWQINTADGLHHEIIILTAGAVTDTTTDLEFV